VKHRTARSALLVAGAAASVAALAWVGKRRYLATAPPPAAFGLETPFGQDDEQTVVRLRSMTQQDETPGVPLFIDPAPDRSVYEDVSLDQIWDAAPRSEADPNDVQEDDLDIDEKSDRET
jgi:hypothetical protein